MLRIAVPVPLRKTFDYLPLPGQVPATLQPGIRLLVPFGNRVRTGYLIEISERTEADPSRLKPLMAVLDDVTLLSAKDIALLKWASRYYHHPLGEVMAAAFPRLLRGGRAAETPGEPHVVLTEAGWALSTDTLTRAPRLRSMLALLKSAPDGLSASCLRASNPSWKKTFGSLSKRGLAELRVPPQGRSCVRNPAIVSPRLNPAQSEAVQTVAATFGRHARFLLDGVTGSGKTEVYLRLAEAALQRDEQVMILLPEISLTPQFEQRFRERFAVPIAVFHSRLRETERLAAWLQIQRGDSPILLGTRSAVWIPMQRPGLIIVDEEHDTSFKQQENFRFSARDVAIQKARYLDVPVLLGSATPSLESLWNVARGRYRAIALPDRAGGAATPRFQLLDIRHQRLSEGLSPPLITLIRKTLQQREQILLFLNRRGYAPTLICDDCGWVAPCSRCDARLVVHLRDGRLRCHYCGLERRMPPACPECTGSELRPLGQGTERLEQALADLFPEQRVLRIDRDSTSRVGSLQRNLERVQRGEVDILVGTQMLAKGHHFPRVTLVAVIDADALLFATDFRASERMSQLIVQVAGRAGRAERAGTVVLQTRQPQHPLLHTLITGGYGRFAQVALEERRLARLPPVHHLVLWRAEARDDPIALQFLQRLRQLAFERAGTSITPLGPAPAPMARQAGRYRYQLMLSGPERRPLHELVDRLLLEIPDIPQVGRVRWSLDVDPVDCY